MGPGSRFACPGRRGWGCLSILIRHPSSPGLPPSLKLRRASTGKARRSLLTAEVRLRTKAVGVDGTGRSSIPEPSAIEPRSRGVLDGSHSRAMTQSTWHAPSGSLRAQRSNPSSRAKGGMDCFVARAPRNDVERDAVSHSRGTNARGFHFVVPRQQREQGMPGARCTRGLVCKIVRRNAHEHTGSAEAVRHSLRNGFTAYAVLSPATNSFLSPSLADQG
jgi:hypothetical protein